MNRLRERRTARLIVVAALAVVALLVWSASTSAQQQPPFLLYGEGEPGDIVTVTDADGQELGMAVVMPNRTWHVSVVCDGDKVQTLSFQVNGAPAEAEIDQTGADQAEIALVAAAAESAEESAGSAEEPAESVSEAAVDELEESGDMFEEGETDIEVTDSESAADESADELMMDDSAADESMADESMADESAAVESGSGEVYPESGSGGLAEHGPSKEALVGTIAVLVAVGVIAVAGVGVRRARRTRNRA